MWILLLFFLVSAHAVNVWRDEIRPTFQEAGKNEHLLVLAGGIAGTALTAPYDQKVRRFRNDDGNLLIGKEDSRRIDHLTDGVLQVATPAVLLAVDTKEGVRLSKALIFTSLSHLSLSRIIGRDRPRKSDSDSLPSGHASSMFAYAGVLAGSYGWKAALPAYSAAALTALSRIKEDDHWASDVVAGMFLGTYWARVVHSETSPTWAFVPVKVGDGIMVSAVYLW